MDYQKTIRYIKKKQSYIETSLFVFVMIIANILFWTSYHNLDLMSNYAMIFNDLNAERYNGSDFLNIRDITDCTAINYCPDFKTIYHIEKMARKKISVIIPMYNEEKRIINTLDDVRSHLIRNNYDYEIVLVDDGSTDNTYEILKKYISQSLDGNIRVFGYNFNRGKGYAVRFGFFNSKHNNKLIMDADNSIRIYNLLAIADWQKPCVYWGYRHQKIKQTKYRMFLGKVFRKVIDVMFGIKDTDTQAPFKLFINSPDDLFDSIKTDGFAYDVELYLECRRRGLEIQKVNVEYFDDKDSKVTFSKTIEMIKELIKIKLKK
jgi:dolichyl-phosphate beta-glucosyltransferase